MSVKILAASKNFRALQFLESQFKGKGIEIIQYCVLPDIIEKYLLLQPDAMLLEMNWPEIYTEDVYNLIAELLRKAPYAKMIAMSTTYDAWLETRAKRAGAKGYVYLDAHGIAPHLIIDHFIQTIKESAHGKFAFTPVELG